ncbi:hypothetical protein BJ741DRAFT_377534 [Chytriomyces cf. hyalinus JEL632]|nr:hypothetical protein BJ741DRAFT_377534 [Chytriomyces cf. hyalinus JEL632]
MSAACLAAQSSLLTSVGVCGISPDASPSNLTPAQAQCLCALSAPLSTVTTACFDEPNVLEAAQRVQQYCASRTGNPAQSPSPQPAPTQQSPFPSFVNPLNPGGNGNPRPTETVSASASSPTTSVISSAPASSAVSPSITSPSNTRTATTSASAVAQSNATAAACEAPLTKLTSIPSDVCFFTKGTAPNADQVTCYCNQVDVVMKGLSAQCAKDPGIEAFRQNYVPVCLLAKSDADRAVGSLVGAAISGILAVAFLI